MAENEAISKNGRSNHDNRKKEEFLGDSRI